MYAAVSYGNPVQNEVQNERSGSFSAAQASA